MAKYTDIRVSKEIYTSSTMDSFVDVAYRENGRLCGGVFQGGMNDERNNN